MQLCAGHLGHKDAMYAQAAKAGPGVKAALEDMEKHDRPQFLKILGNFAEQYHDINSCDLP